MAKIRLARLPTNWAEQPETFRRYWDESMKSIETSLNAILAIPEIEAAIAAAEAAAENAQNAADNANAAAEGAAAESSIVSSFPTGYTPPLIEANSTGLVTIANHSRQYGDIALNPTVSVTGNSIATTASANQTVRVYYIDPGRVGGSVTYQYTIDPAAPPVQGGNIHVVGAVIIPATGSNPGGGVNPPGWVEPPALEP